MSKFTEFLNLFKWDPVEDAEEEFNIDKSLNENWDKIDKKLKDYITENMLKSDYDKNNDGIVDDTEKVNGHTVESDVPANAKFTDTLYDDKGVQEKISAQSDKIEKNQQNIGTTSDTYDKTKTYAVDEIVIQNGLLYKCKTAVTTAEEFDSSKWEKISILDSMLFFVKEGEF